MIFGALALVTVFFSLLYSSPCLSLLFSISQSQFLSLSLSSHKEYSLVPLVPSGGILGYQAPGTLRNTHFVFLELGILKFFAAYR